MKSRRPVLLAVVLTAGISATTLAACVSEEPEPTVEEVQRHRHGAVAAVVDTAFERADLTAAQAEALEGIQQRISLDRQTRRELGERMRRSASDVVRAGTTDSAAFDASIEEAAVAMEERVELSAAAVKDVHALLSPEQRSAVAEGLRERIANRWGEHRRRRHEAFRDFAQELTLTDEQVEGLKKIRDEMLGQAKQLRPSVDELYELVDAFETEAFPEVLDAFHAERAPLLREKLAEASVNADAALGLLETNQRDVLADIIEHGRDVVRDDRAAR